MMARSAPARSVVNVAIPTIGILAAIVSIGVVVHAAGVKVVTSVKPSPVGAEPPIPPLPLLRPPLPGPMPPAVDRIPPLAEPMPPSLGAMPPLLGPAPPVPGAIPPLLGPAPPVAGPMPPDVGVLPPVPPVAPALVPLLPPMVEPPTLGALPPAPPLLGPPATPPVAAASSGSDEQAVTARTRPLTPHAHPRVRTRNDRKVFLEVPHRRAHRPRRIKVL